MRNSYVYITSINDALSKNRAKFGHGVFVLSADDLLVKLTDISYFRFGMFGFWINTLA